MSNLSLLPTAAARVIVVEEVVVVAQVAEAEASAWGRGHVCKWKEEEKTVLPRPVAEEGEAGKRREIDPLSSYTRFLPTTFSACLPSPPHT